MQKVTRVHIEWCESLKTSSKQWGKIPHGVPIMSARNIQIHFISIVHLIMDIVPKQHDSGATVSTGTAELDSLKF